jgi:hypothetical protein
MAGGGRMAAAERAWKIIIFLVFAFFFLNQLFPIMPRIPGVYDPIRFGHTSYLPPLDSKGMHILFLGNSYTFVNDLPRMIADVAASDTENPVIIQPGIFSRGAATLEELWNANVAQDAIRSRHWDYVVLQELSVAPVEDGLIPQMQDAMTQWSGLARAAGATPVVYETWARKGGSNWYNRAKYPELNLGDPVKMQIRIDDVTNSIAAQLQLPVIPIGDYWAACQRGIKGFPDLYYRDGTHPSLAGDYLVALLFYRNLTGHKLDHVTYIPFGISSEEARLLVQCASSN